MKIAVFADERSTPIMERVMERLSKNELFKQYVLYKSYDEFISDLASSESQITVVAHGGAHGMECVRAAKILMPKSAIVWISNDEGFGPESYRVGCSYFSAEPISEGLLTNAFTKCYEERSMKYE